MNKKKHQRRIDCQDQQEIHANQVTQGTNTSVKSLYGASLKTFFVNKRSEIFSICLTTVFTLLGFLLTIGNDYFSQYYYNYGLEFPSQETVSFDDIKANSDTIKPKYYFILDVSGSIRTAKDVNLSNDIRAKINEIKESGYLHHKHNFDVDKDTKKMSYRRLLQVHLLYSLKRLFDLEKDNMKVVFFSDGPEEVSPQILTFHERKKIFNDIYGEEFKGLNSNFIHLFSYLQRNIINSLPPTDRYKRRECHLVFFSDYKHETNNEKYDYDDLRKQISEFLCALDNKNVDVKLHYIESVDYGSNGNTLNDSNNNTLLKLLKSESSSSKVEILDVDKGLISPMISSKPIPFCYSNSLFEEKLTTQMVFSKGIDLAFGIASEPENMKQEYYLLNGDVKTHLSSNLQDVSIIQGVNVNLMIKGYIPSPYKSPDIIIEDKNEGVKYIVPVVFYKKFPKTGYVIIFLIFVLTFIMIAVYVNYTKAKTNDC